MKKVLTILLLVFVLAGCSPKEWFKTLGERMCPCCSKAYTTVKK